MNDRTFSQNLSKRGKRHHHNHLWGRVARWWQIGSWVWVCTPFSDQLKNVDPLISTASIPKIPNTVSFSCHPDYHTDEDELIRDSMQPVQEGVQQQRGCHAAPAWRAPGLARCLRLPPIQRQQQQHQRRPAPPVPADDAEPPAVHISADHAHASSCCRWRTFGVHHPPGFLPHPAEAGLLGLSQTPHPSLTAGQHGLWCEEGTRCHHP